jgi:hypothetical protein
LCCLTYGHAARLLPMLISSASSTRKYYVYQARPDRRPAADAPPALPAHSERPLSCTPLALATTLPFETGEDLAGRHGAGGLLALHRRPEHLRPAQPETAFGTRPGHGRHPESQKGTGAATTTPAARARAPSRPVSRKLQRAPAQQHRLRR